MVVVFDLDNTLYDEWSFVDGGLDCAASFLAEKLDLNQKAIFRRLKELVREKRDHVFDRFLLENGCHSDILVRKCIKIYRSHHPKIKLWPDAKKCLKRFPGSYLLTDGNFKVQKSKAEALGLPKIMERCIYTGAYGADCAKPSPYCFFKICEWEDVDPSEVVYVGDDPRKDFRIKQYGFKTIRVLTGPYSQLKVPKKYDADITIKNLNALTREIL